MKEKKDFDVSFNTTLSDEKGGGGINVVSKKKLSHTPENYAKLREKFQRIEESRLAKEAAGQVAEAKAEEGKEEMFSGKSEDSASEGRSKRIVLITHFNVFLYAACYWIQSGTLPYLTKSLGADPVIFGRLKTVFSLCQLVGGPIYGRLGDLMGERTALITAFSASILTYILTGLATSLPLLFLSRVPSVFLHVMQGSQMVVTALSGSNDRAAALARLGFSYGVGMVIGPSLGGFVAGAYGEHAAAWLAALGSAVSLALVIYFVPEVPRPREEKGDSVLNIAKIGALLLIPKARNLLLLKTICGVPIGVLQSMFSLIAMEQFQLPPEQNGMVLSYIGGLSMLMQGVGISACTSRFSDKTLLQFSCVSLILSFYLMALLTTIQDFLLLQVPMVCSLTLINSILQASLTRAVPQVHTGTMLGLNMAVNSTIRSLAPTIGGVMMAAYGFSSIGALGVVCNIVTLAIVRMLRITN